jgi:Na+-translocating ferredoxin:NAD+ oxidoreductase RNF subunit RnfB
MSEVEPNLIKKLKQAASAVIGAGPIPFPVTDTLMEILKFYLDEEDLEFLKAFRMKSSMSMEELMKKTKLEETQVNEKANKLAKKGFIFNQPSSKGVMVFRVLPLVVIGAFEYTFMQTLPSDEEGQARLRHLAKLYEKLMHELTQSIQEGYDNVLPIFQKQPPVDRTIPLYENVTGTEIPIEKEIAAEEKILPSQTVEEIIKKYDDIAVGNCFCRQYQQMLGNPCKIHAPMEVCFTFGKSARHVLTQGFARRVTKEEALKILKATEDAGLVHKAFHNASDITKEENSICNCCKCCCDTFNLWRMGATPLVNSTNYLSVVKQDECTACGTCIEKCPMDAIALNENGKAQVNPNLCIGCGICAHFCPATAILLKEGMRIVYAPPPRLQ